MLEIGYNDTPHRGMKSPDLGPQARNLFERIRADLVNQYGDIVF